MHLAVRGADDGTIDLVKVRMRVEEFVAARPHVAPRPRAGIVARSLPGGHSPAPSLATGHEHINEMLRSAAHGRAY